MRPWLGMDAVDFETDVFMARIMINTKELISRQANYVPQAMPLPIMTYFGEEIGHETDPANQTPFTTV